MQQEIFKLRSEKLLFESILDKALQKSTEKLQTLQEKSQAKINEISADLQAAQKLHSDLLTDYEVLVKSASEQDTLCSDLEQDNNSLLDQLEMMDQEKQFLESRNHELLLQIEGTEKTKNLEIFDLQAAISESKQELLMEQVTTQSRQAELETQRLKFEEIIAHQDAQIEALKLHQDSSLLSDKLQVKINQLEAASSEKDQQIESLKSQVAQAAEQSGISVSDLKKELSETIQSYEAELEDRESLASQDIQKLKLDLERIQIENETQIESYKSKLAALEAEKIEISQASVDSKTAALEFQSQIADLQAKNDAKIQKLEDEKEDLLVKLETAEALHSEETAQLLSDLNQAESEIELLTNKCKAIADAVSDEAAEYKAKYEVVESGLIAKHQAEIEVLKAEISRVSKDYEQEKSRSESSANILKDQLEKKEIQISLLNVELSAALEAVRQQKAELETSLAGKHQEEIRLLNQELAAAQNKFEEEKRSLSSQAESVNDQLKKSQFEIDRLKEALSLQLAEQEIAVGEKHRKELETLQAELSKQFDDEKTRILNESEFLRDQLQQRQAEIEQINVEETNLKQSYELELKSREAELGVLRKNFENSEASMKEELQLLRSLQLSVSQTPEELKQPENQDYVKSLEEEIEQLKLEIATLSAASAAAAASSLAETNVLGSLKEEIGGLQQAMQTQEANFKANLNKMKLVLEEKEHLIERLREDLAHSTINNVPSSAPSASNGVAAPPSMWNIITGNY
jgi:hypothetical protein